MALDGQFDLRVSHKPDTPVTANVLVLESRVNGRGQDAAIMVSCDLVLISDSLLDEVRQAVQKQLPGFDPAKMFLNATHTHTAPLTRSGVYELPQQGVTGRRKNIARSRPSGSPSAIERAWNGRQQGSFTWGLGHAAVAENRRATYADGHATMYGMTAQPDFRGLEGYVDHDIGSLFFWNQKEQLIAVVVDVACPSQEVENLSSINADFWHPVRESLRKRYGKDVCVLGWCGAAGDQSPHPMIGRHPGHLVTHAEERMRELRKLSRLEEIARRIVAAVDETYEAVKSDRHADVPLIHKTETLQLPTRLVTDKEYAEIKALMERDKPSQMARRWNQRILDRYEEQKTNPHPVRDTTVHVVRLGDVAICTNTFELFTDYGIQIKSRSRAAQTFVIQLTGGGPCCYVPTKRAVQGGGYSAVVQSNLIGPEGGQVLVDRTVQLINGLWESPAGIGVVDPMRERSCFLRRRITKAKTVKKGITVVRTVLTVALLLILLLARDAGAWLPAGHGGSRMPTLRRPSRPRSTASSSCASAQKADTPLTANVLVLDSRENGRSLDVAVMVSCDLIIISDPLAAAVREAVSRRLPEFDLQKIVLNATHTHTAPLTVNGVYDIPKTGVMQVDEYCRFAGERIAEAIEKAWKGRTPGSLTWGLGHAVVAQNRRAVFADGHAELAGNTDRPDFRGLEAGEDHDLGSLFFWNEKGKLVAIVVNVPCPAQEVEGLSSINADFWHPTRKSLQERYGADVCVLGWAGWAGDQSPHLTHHKAAEERMRELRKISRLEEIARRIVGGGRRGLRGRQGRSARRRASGAQSGEDPSCRCAW